MRRFPSLRTTLVVVAALAATTAITSPAAANPTAGSISGILTTSGGAPSPHGSATLWTVDQDYVGHASTNRSGRYLFSDVPAGSYKIEFRTQDNLRQWAHQKSSFQAADAIVLDAGAALVVDEVLRPTGSISGRLTRSNGAPVAYASVTAIAPGADFGYGDTDQNGHYRIPALFPGDYKIEFQLLGGFRQFAHQERTLDAADTFTVVAGQDTVVDDVLLPTGSIAGRFLDRSGGPLPDVSVEVTGAGSTSWATTDSTGAYRVDDLSTGDDYRVAFSDQNRTWRQYATGRTGPQDADRYPVTDGGTTVVDDQLLPAGGLQVTARDSATGLPVSDYCLYLEGAGSRNLCTDDGSLSFTDLAPGTYSGSTDTAGDYLPQQVPVTVQSGETTTLEIVFVLGGTITALVTDAATGTPLADACVAVARAGTGVLRPDGYHCTDSTGTVSAPRLAPGDYNVFVKAPDGSGLGAQWVGTTGGTGDAVTARRITVSSGATATVAPALDPAGTITGQVRSASGGALITSGVVALYPHDHSGNGVVGTAVDGQGRYTIDWLGPYRWPLVFDVPDHARQWSGGTGNRLLAQKTQVTAGATATYDVHLRVGTVVTGVVRDQAGQPRAGAGVYAYNAVTGEEVGRGGGASGYRMLVVGPQLIKIKSEVHNGYGHDTVWYDDDGSFAAARTVLISGTGTRTLDIVNPAG
ncbi:carboxypeptidase-like regulatory domain-containing protein [Polymorphospora rubra]|uniref:carboxypeptidase-like regulatory domain-containing protein n=1 Tax=Polymorphospora rubra TaxID=338584 RepID=UPI001BB3E043|nr:carboxypeptidase-like regulatory domain-containing protein [Polymorphospora rubra]